MVPLGFVPLTRLARLVSPVNLCLLPLALCLWTWCLWAGLCEALDLVPLPLGWEANGAYWIGVVLRLDMHSIQCAHMTLVQPHPSHCPPIDYTLFVVIINT